VRPRPYSALQELQTQYDEQAGGRSEQLKSAIPQRQFAVQVTYAPLQQAGPMTSSPAAAKIGIGVSVAGATAWLESWATAGQPASGEESQLGSRAKV
jgi:hypothetical protein